MVGFSVGTRDTALLRDIVAATHAPATTPLGWPVLHLVLEMLRADAVSFACLDSAIPRVVFEQCVDADGDHACSAETAAGARENPFWQQYWGPRGCAYPDLSGDYRVVRRASDHQSLRERREVLASRGVTDRDGERYLEACLPGRTPGRYLRLGAYRRGRDFTDREVFLLRLLQPHLEQAFWSGAGRRQADSGLTRRQLEILRLVRDGCSNREIARRTGTTEGTVHVHLSHIFRRLGVQSRTAAVHAVFDLPGEWPAGSPHAADGP